MSDNKTGFVVTADTNPFQQAMRRLADQAREGSQSVQKQFDGLNGVLDGLRARWMAVATAIGAGAGIKAAVERTAEMTVAAQQLGRQLGISATEARDYISALENVGLGTSELADAGKGLVRQLRENEDKIVGMGLKTRDAAGNLRPMNDLLVESIELLNTYKEGTDRNLASATLFGRGVDASSRLLQINKAALDEARVANEELGLTVGARSVAAWEEYNAASDRAALSVKGITKAIGDQMMPVITRLVEIFNAVMPAAIVVVRGALGGLATAFHGVVNGVVVLWETINAMVITLTEPLRAFVSAVFKVFSGDMEGAAEQLRNVPKVVAGAWDAAFDRMVNSSRKTADLIAGAFSADNQPAGNGGTKGTRSFIAPKDKKDAKEPAEQSAMQVYEAALQQRILLFQSENVHREHGKAQELAYWQDILNTYQVGSKDRVAIALKTGKLEVDINREKAARLLQIDLLHAEDRKAADLDAINEMEANARQQVELGQITQAEQLARQVEFNQQRLQVELEFMRAKEELALLDPERNVLLLEQIEMQKAEIRRKYAMQARDIQREIQRASPEQSIFQTMEQSFGAAITGMITQAQTLRQALANIWGSILSAFVSEMIAKPIAMWMARIVRETALYKALFGVQVSTQAAASGATVAMKSAESSAVVGMEASKAAAGAAASQAGIPIIGPALAMAAAVAMLAFVMGMGNKGSTSTTTSKRVPSAAGGFDIPRGLNPLTQLHEEEMVLPKGLANPLRQALSGEGPGLGGNGGTTTNHYHINAVDARSFQQLLQDNPAALASGIANATRRGHRS